MEEVANTVAPVHTTLLSVWRNLGFNSHLPRRRIWKKETAKTAPLRKSPTGRLPKHFSDSLMGYMVSGVGKLHALQFEVKFARRDVVYKSNFESDLSTSDQ